MTRLVFMFLTFKEPLAFTPYSLVVKLRFKSNESLSKLFGPRAKTSLKPKNMPGQKELSMTP